MSVGVMKDYKLKLRKLRASHALGWPWKNNMPRMIITHRAITACFF
jgi:hypothetical protein